MAVARLKQAAVKDKEERDSGTESGFFAAGPLPGCVVRERKVVRANQAWGRLCGLDVRELAARPLVELVQAADRRLLDELGSRVLRVRLNAPEGKTVPVQLFAAELQPGILAVQAVPETDIARAPYEDLLQNISDIVHIHTASDGRIVYLNPSFSRLFGFRTEDWVGRRVRDLVTPRFRHLYDDYAKKLMEKGHHEGIMCLLDAYGKERYVEYRDVLLENGGELLVRGIAHEVTERVTRARSLEQMVDGITLAMADLVEQRDPYTSGHQKRVAEIAVTIAQQMGYPEERLRPLFIAASLHDIGKISIPTEILAKPASLTRLERQFIEQHPSTGADILRRVPFPWNVAGVILNHHERLNGSGYPRGLKGAEIDEESRILAVADVYEAMTTHRPYRPALSTAEALRELTQKSDVLYDREVVQVLVKMIDSGC
jgi:PAS domain S-box-containing protein/putative nucleotidyltransferase with HDIG domain